MSPNRQASHYLDFDSDRRHQSRLIYNAVFPVNFQEQPPRNDAGEFLRDRSFFRPEYYIIHKSGYQNNQTLNGFLWGLFSIFGAAHKPHRGRVYLSY